ncbi:MAG: PTS transporter subunit EIIC, partial [Bacillota bacterium]|nr:PTS transporter subunit EIIC [Bacillota bacterium]
MAKSEQLSVLGKAAIGPGLFNINEPIIFGVPIMYNPALIIPFICAPTITSIVVLLLLKSGIFPPIIAEVPWCTPIGLGAFLGTASFMGVVLSLIGFALDLAIYFPFLVKYDKELVKQEAEMNAAQ